MTRVTTRLSTAPATTTLPAEDIERARAFYGQTLGLETERRDALPDELLVRAGRGTRILLYRRERTKADNTALTFEVDDLEATMRELRDQGVRFEEYDFPGLKTVDGIASRETDRAAWFKDSEGNTLCLHELAA